MLLGLPLFLSGVLCFREHEAREIEAFQNGLADERIEPINPVARPREVCCGSMDSTASSRSHFADSISFTSTLTKLLTHHRVKCRTLTKWVGPNDPILKLSKIDRHPLAFNLFSIAFFPEELLPELQDGPELVDDGPIGGLYGLAVLLALGQLELRAGRLDGVEAGEEPPRTARLSRDLKKLRMGGTLSFW